MSTGTEKDQVIGLNQNLPLEYNDSGPSRVGSARFVETTFVNPEVLCGPKVHFFGTGSHCQLPSTCPFWAALVVPSFCEAAMLCWVFSLCSSQGSPWGFEGRCYFQVHLQKESAQNSWFQEGSFLTQYALTSSRDQFVHLPGPESTLLSFLGHSSYAAIMKYTHRKHVKSLWVSIFLSLSAYGINGIYNQKP